MQKRKLEELNLLDDFLFGTMVTHPEVGEPFVRELLRIILGRELRNLKIIPQKVYYGSDTDLHGARLDVYLEEDGASIFDVEPDKNDNRADIAALPKRVRFYHAKIDARSLKAGADYSHLKNVIIIMITPYDPFGCGRMIYTIRSLCEEDPSIPYDDGARTVFLYTGGTKGNPPEELKTLLYYMEHTTPENVKGDHLKTIQKMVERVKKDEEVSLEYMKIFEREQMLINQGRREGIKEGRLAEQQNTERERLRADKECLRANSAEKELKILREKLAQLEQRNIR